MSELKYLNLLYLNKNYFTSTVPAVFGNLNQLNFLSLSDNLLTGTLSSELSKLRSLEVLFLFSNLFSGSVEQLFSATTQTALKYVDLSSNQLQGSLPTELFKIKGLRSFAAVSNCFQGAIPDSICSAENLTTLALDGLKSASSCERRFFPVCTHIHSYGLSEHISGGVPACLFRMPHLQTLHISGNGLTGSIQTDTSLDTTADAADTTATNKHTEHISTLFAFGADIRRNVLYLTLFLLFVSMPIYVALNFYYSSYKVVYAWQLSASYLTGFTAAVILLRVLLVFLLFLFIGRFITSIQLMNSSEHDNLSTYLRILNSECRGAREQVAESSGMLVLVSSIFYSFFLLDTLGDEIGWRHALWIGGVMTAVPIAVFKAAQWYVRCYPVDVEGEEEGDDESEGGGLSERRQSDLRVGSEIDSHDTSATSGRRTSSIAMTEKPAGRFNSVSGRLSSTGGGAVNNPMRVSASRVSGVKSAGELQAEEDGENEL
eukprot:gene25053-31463_t